MKTILILADISNTGSIAKEACVMLGSKLHTDLLLFNTYESIPITVYYAGTPWVDKVTSPWEIDARKKLKQLSSQLKSLIAELDQKYYKPVVRVQIAEGKLGPGVATCIKEKKIDMVIMGARSGTPLEHILLGSDTRSVITHSHRPVLIIPRNYALKKIEKITFASCFDPAETQAISYLIQLEKIFGFKLEVLYIKIFGQPSEPADQVLNFAKQINGLSCKSLNYKTIRGKDVTQRLNRYCKENKPDILAFMHHQSNFFSRLFGKSTTTKALSNQQLPLLVIPSNMI